MDLTSIPWGSIGPPGLLALVVLFIIRGDLVPARYYRQAIEDNRILREANDELRAQNNLLVNSVRLPVNAMTAIEQRANAQGQETAT